MRGSLRSNDPSTGLLVTDLIGNVLQARIFLNSVPKAGAHLVEKALQLAGCPRGARPLGSETLLGRRQWAKQILRGARNSSEAVVLGVEISVSVRRGWVDSRLAGTPPGQYLRGHVQYSESFEELLRERSYQLLQVARDPRDVAVSHAHYVFNRKRHPFHSYYASLPDLASRVCFSISGGEMPGIGRLTSLAERYSAIEPWIDRPDSLTLRFEDLVGEAGGGTLDRQSGSIASLLGFLRLEADADSIDRLREQLFGGTSTFRRGRIGGWRETFDETCRGAYRALDRKPLERWESPTSPDD